MPNLKRTTISIDKEKVKEAKEHFREEYKEIISTSQLMRRILSDFLDKKRLEKT